MVCDCLGWMVIFFSQMCTLGFDRIILTEDSYQFKKKSGCPT